MFKNNQATYGSVAKFFHWLIFFLVFCMLFLGYFMGDVSDKPTRAMVVNIHKLIGLSILVLMLLRLFWALINPKPSLPAGTPRWQRVIERFVHFLLYAVLIAMPIVGWIGSVAGGHLPYLFTWTFGLPIEKNKTLSDLFFSIHGTVAIVIIVLVSLHVLAALYHYVVKKDDILQRMI